jgi:hypothetical protein
MAQINIQSALEVEFGFISLPIGHINSQGSTNS